MQIICLAVSQVGHTVEFELDTAKLDDSSYSSGDLFPAITLS